MSTFKFKNKVIVLLVFITSIAFAQESRFLDIEKNLKTLSKDNPGLNGKVELSVNGVSIQEFIRGLATANSLNVSIDESIKVNIVNNFTNVSVADVLLFLCKKYDLDINFVGNIISVKKYEAPPIPAPKYVAKRINIEYDQPQNLLTLDLSNDSLSMVLKEITKKTKKNVLYSPDLSGTLVSCYIESMPFDAAIEKFAFANNLKVTPTEDNFYLMEKQDAEPVAVVKNSRRNGKAAKANTSTAAASGEFDLKVSPDSLITLEAIDVPIAEILSEVSAELKIDYYLFAQPKGNTSLNVTNLTFNEFLKRLFSNTDFTFNKEGNIYLIGERESERLRVTQVYQLKHRTVEKVTDFIPANLKKGIDIKTFTDQNSLILSGSEPNIQELIAFLRAIDKVVPVITIEVIIADVRNTHAVSTGIKAGLGTAPATTGGDVFPGVDMTLSAKSINSVIDGVNGAGLVNLGKVTPNFYLSLQMMEQNGSIKINSTPLLSTLNGHEAKMNISETRYYVEQNSNVIATQNTTTVNTIQYKPLTADFSLTINPIVSGDEQITMNVSVKKQSFTEQTAGKNGPYGTSTRDFQSLIRVKNQEMIMLGGLDEKIKDESSSGVPVLSRIPVIKWLFSSRTKKKSKSQLTIFIKATVIY